VPYLLKPAEFCRNNFKVGYGVDRDQAVQFAKGTTTLAFKYQGGVIVSVDSRATMGPYICKFFYVYLLCASLLNSNCSL
jgi:20S proteasome subunit beta 5